MMSIYLYHHYNALKTLFVINMFYVSGQYIHTRIVFNLEWNSVGTIFLSYYSFDILWYNKGEIKSVITDKIWKNA